MVHEIFPDTFDPAFQSIKATGSDYSLFYKDELALIKYRDGVVSLPVFSDIQKLCADTLPLILEQAYYLFSINKQPYFLIELPLNQQSSIPIAELDKDSKLLIQTDSASDLYLLNAYKLRELNPITMIFAGATGAHIARWKQSRTFCGKCGAKTIPSTKERAFICPDCGQVEYPKISPAIIVAIKNDNKLLLVRNNYGPYRKPALVAGFVEVGESFEQAVHREVLEEVGLRVKNIKYYKSQPWAFSDTEMIGFTADLDGDDTITLQESELAEGGWFTREEIPELPYRLSVGSEMIHQFKIDQLP